MHGDPRIADTGFAGADCEALLDSLGATLLRPDRQDERRRDGSLGAIRQSIESVFDTLKGQPSLERHGAHTMPGLVVRIASDDLAMATVWSHSWQRGHPGRHLIACDH